MIVFIYRYHQEFTMIVFLYGIIYSTIKILMEDLIMENNLIQLKKSENNDV